MAYTWAEFRALVLSLSTDAQPCDDTYTIAVAEYCKAKFAREVDHDLDAYASYFKDYLTQRNRLFGYQYGGDVPTLTAAVGVLVTVDANRQGAQAYLNALIKQARLDLEGNATLIQNWIRQGVIDIQSHIPLYRVGQVNTFLVGDVTPTGMASVGNIPESAQIRDVFYAPLASGVTAINMTNEGSGYTQATGMITGDGTGAQLTPAKVWDGKVKGFDVMTRGHDYTNAVLAIVGDGVGAAGLPVIDVACTPMNPYDWSNREDLINGRVSINSSNFHFAIDPWGGNFYAYPALDAQHKIVMTWDGLKLTFADADPVPFDESMAQVVSEYLKGHFAREVLRDYALSQTYLKPGGSYFMKRRRLLLDAQDRLRIKNA